jgi:ABC-2 type transport system permease protein
MPSSILLLRSRILAARNAMRTLPRHMWFHFAIGAMVLSLLMAGGTFIFYRIFRFLMELEVFGPPLMDLLVGIIFLAFFAMLIFSNLIITLSTSYISREVDFLMELPVAEQTIFRQKLAESIVYSSWAFAILSLPFFLGFGLSRGASPLIYPMIALLVIPFLAIPAMLGSILTMMVTSFLPARRTRTLSIVLGVLSVILAIGMARLMGVRRIFSRAGDDNFDELMNFLQVGSNDLVPSTWLMRGVLALMPNDLGPPDFASFLYWFAMLAATGLFLYQVSEWLVGPLYKRGWQLSKDSASRDQASSARRSLLDILGSALWFLPVNLRALAIKDLKTFWRDPSQWTQLVVLFGLMVIYIANLRSIQRHSSAIEGVFESWRTVLAFFNLGAICFILSILTTRFVFPMLSLEGRQYWSVGMAPMGRTTIVWQKFAFCAGFSLIVAVSLLCFSNWVLRVDLFLQAISIATAVIMAFALSSLSVGLGAFFPNFREDNPARIANGVGGTLNAIVSMLYIGFTVGMLSCPMHYLLTVGWSWLAERGIQAVLFVALFVVIQISALIVPMMLGLRHWRRLEF